MMKRSATVLATAVLTGLVAVAAPRAFAEDGIVKPESCKATAPARAEVFGEFSFYANCFKPRAINDYGYVHIQNLNPATVDYKTLDEKEKKTFLKFLESVRRKVLQKSVNGKVIVTVTSSRGKAKPVPVDIVELMDFKINEKNEYSISSTSENLNNQVGSILRYDPMTKIQIKTYILYTADTNTNISAALKPLKDILKPAAFGFKTAVVPDAVFKLFSDFEAALTDSKGEIISQTNTKTLTFDPKGDSGVSLRYRLIPNTSLSGEIFASLDNRLSLFDGFPADVRDGLVSLNARDIGDTYRNFVRDAYIDDSTLDEHLTSDLKDSDSPALGGRDILADITHTADPALFDKRCLVLARFAKSLSLQTQDSTAIVWAYAAENPNAGKRSFQQGDCLKSLVAYEFPRYGLPFPKLIQEMSLSYSTVWKAYKTAEVSAMDAFSKAVDAEKRGTKVSNDAKYADLPLNQETGQYSNGTLERVFGKGAYSYEGELRAPGKAFVGARVEDRADYMGDAYIGEFVQDGIFLKGEGYGTYTFGNNPTASGRKKYTGQLHNNYFEGFGRMEYANGDVFLGEFSADLPKGNGVMILSDGTKRYGFFDNGLPNGPVIEVRADSTRTGTATNGVISYTEAP